MPRYNNQLFIVLEIHLLISAPLLPLPHQDRRILKVRRYWTPCTTEPINQSTTLLKCSKYDHTAVREAHWTALIKSTDVHESFCCSVLFHPFLFPTAPMHNRTSILAQPRILTSRTSSLSYQRTKTYRTIRPSVNTPEFDALVDKCLERLAHLKSLCVWSGTWVMLQTHWFKLQNYPSEKVITGTTPKGKYSRRSLLIWMMAEYNIKLQMFSRARGVSICNSEINNVAGDMIINVHGQSDLEPVQVPLSSNAIPFFHSWLGMLVVDQGLLDRSGFGQSFNCSIRKHNFYIGTETGDSE